MGFLKSIDNRAFSEEAHKGVIQLARLLDNQSCLFGKELSIEGDSIRQCGQGLLTLVSTCQFVFVELLYFETKEENVIKINNMRSSP